jgi:hypothetical protein
MRTDVPQAWKNEPEAWWEHVAQCPDCGLHFVHVHTDDDDGPYFIPDPPEFDGSDG